MRCAGGALRAVPLGTPGLAVEGEVLGVGRGSLIAAVYLHSQEWGLPALAPSTRMAACVLGTSRCSHTAMLRFHNRLQCYSASRFARITLVAAEFSVRHSTAEGRAAEANPSEPLRLRKAMLALPARRSFVTVPDNSTVGQVTTAAGLNT